MAMLDFPGELVDLDKDQQTKLRKFLYPAEVLLVCLNDTCPRGHSQKASDAPLNPNQSPEEMFHAVVNKLAQICDFEPKGDTITALAIILKDARICYVLASNRRGTGALKNARAGLKAVLDILKSNLEAKTKASDEVIERRLIEEILRRNNVRVRSYLNSLGKELQKCIKKCDTGTQEGRLAAEALDKLAGTLPGQEEKTAGEKSEKYIECIVQCIKAIQENRRSQLQRFIETRAMEDSNMAKGGSWSSLQHAAGRLLSYQYAVQTLVHAHHIWGDTDLFRDYEIESIRSSGPYPADALKLQPETVEAVINRAPGYGQARLQELKRHAADLQIYDLDTKFKERLQQKMDPIVHAEILLHAWLSNTDGGIQSHRFFQGWRYIGSSKPICRMCQEYFNHIATPVQFRSGHPNYYLNWRLPDTYIATRERNNETSIKCARESWCKDLGEMKRRVYAAVVRILEEKVSDRKPHDSNTYTERITGLGDTDRLANWLEHVRLK